MIPRLWYPQLDVYDTVRRMLGLLLAWPEQDLTSERLYISDFYLANPPLLHRTHMPSNIRKEFQALSIVRPEKSFLSFPSPQMLFAKMEPVQKEALRTLVGKGFVALDALRVGKIVADEKLTQIGDMIVLSSDERRVVTFLTSGFARIGAGVPGDLRLATGLRRPGT
jgi:hypothetical protein